MNLIRRPLQAVRRSAQKGFTLIELAIVGLFLGLLAIFAISQFSGSATATTRANSIFEATTKIADNWAMVSQACGISSDITIASLASATGATTTSGTAATATANLDVLLGVTPPGTYYQSCYNSAGIRPLNGVATGGAGGELIQKLPVTIGLLQVNGKNAVGITYGAANTSAAVTVTDDLILPLYNKYSSTVGASTVSAMPVTGESADNTIRFSVVANRTMTIVKSL